MSKKTLLLFFIILTLSSMTLPHAEALGIGPPFFDLDLQIDGSNSRKFYITSDGLEGQLIVGMEDLPFRVEPLTINISRSDVNLPVEITFYGNETLDPGIYEGKITFLASTGGFVTVGIKIKATINLFELVPEIPGVVTVISSPETNYESSRGESINLEYIVDFEGNIREHAEMELDVTYPSGAVYNGYTAKVGDEDIELDERPISGVPGVTLSTEDMPFGRLVLSVLLTLPEQGGDYESNIVYDFSIYNSTALVDSETGEHVYSIQIETEAEGQTINYTPYILGVGLILALIVWWTRR